MEAERKYKQSWHDTLKTNDQWISWIKFDCGNTEPMRPVLENIQEKFYNYAYMPGTENDAKVQYKLKSMRHIFGLAELLEKFELALMPYIQARSKFETTMNNLKGIVGTLFITHTEGDMMTEKFK